LSSKKGEIRNLLKIKLQKEKPTLEIKIQNTRFRVYGHAKKLQKS
jgi:hypothetical protein